MRSSVLVPLVLAVLSTALEGATPLASEVHAAIVASVRARMGQAAIVTVEGLDVRQATSAAGLRAVPDAGSKVGGPMRFVLVDASLKGAVRRIGSADATVTVSVPHVRARLDISRRQVLASSDLAMGADDVGRVPLERLPTMAEAVGAAARRDLKPGALLTRAILALPPLVESGDEVVTIVRVGQVEARGRAIAAGTAAMGERVRVVINRRAFRGRVVGPREVEIQR